MLQSVYSLTFEESVGQPHRVQVRRQPDGKGKGAAHGVVVFVLLHSVSQILLLGSYVVLVLN